MDSPFDALPRVQPSDWPDEPYPAATGIMDQVFDATDTTYKFYWFLSLLERVFRAEENHRLALSMLEIGQEMIGKPLIRADRNALRSISTRAEITSTSFTDHHQWGDLKADPLQLFQ